MKLGSLRITGSGLTAHGYRVFLNDQDISHCLEGLTVVLSPTEINRAEIVLGLDRIEIDAETIATLTAVIQQQEGGRA